MTKRGGYTRSEDHKRALRAGAIAYWSKPENREAESRRKKAAMANPEYKASWLKAYCAKTGKQPGGAPGSLSGYLPRELRNLNNKLWRCGVSYAERKAIISEAMGVSAS